MPEPMYLLMKRGLYWRPGGTGYTGLKREAGRYSDAESAAIASERDDERTWRLLESDAPRFAPSCDSVIRTREIERASLHAMDLVRECIRAEERRRAHLKPGSVAAGYCDGRLERLRAALAELEG